MLQIGIEDVLTECPDHEKRQGEEAAAQRDWEARTRVAWELVPPAKQSGRR